MKTIILYFGLLMLLVGCMSPRTQPSTTATEKLTKTIVPTATIPSIPTLTTTPSPAVTTFLTVTPSLTPAASQTPDVAATVMAIEQPTLYASYPSPDGIWRVDIIIYNCVKTFKTDEGGWIENAYEQMILVNLANGQKQVADDQIQYCGGLGGFGFEGLFWSQNSRYFYYTPARQGVPDGCGYWEKPVYRFDVPGLVNREDLGIGNRSPDGKDITTWNWPGNTLTLWSINDSTHTHLPILEPKAEIGPIVWSADSQSLVYLQVDSWCPLSGKSYLVLVDIAKFEQTMLLESESPTFGSVEWETAGILHLIDQDGKGWSFDITTRELTQNP